MKRLSLKRIVLFLIASAMTLSIAVPPGAAFALEGESPVNAEVQQDLVAAEQVASPKSPSAVTDSPTSPNVAISTPLLAAETPELQQSPPLATPPQATVIIGPETIPAIIATGFEVSSTLETIELYNQTDQSINVSGLRLRLSAPNEAQCYLTPAVSGWILPKHFLSLDSPTSGSASDMLSGDCYFTQNITRIELFDGDIRLQLIDAVTFTKAKHKSTVLTSCLPPKTFPATLKQTGSAANDFVNCPNASFVGSDELYLPPPTVQLKIVELMTDSRACVPVDSSDDCVDFIKVVNRGAVPVNLAELRLRTGASSSGSTLSNAFHWHQSTLHPERDELLLAPGGFFTVNMRDNGDVLTLTNGAGNVWLEDYYGVKTYDSVIYQSMDTAAARGLSWMFDESDNVWKYGIPTPQRALNQRFVAPAEPGRGTIIDERVPCREDQYRSDETGRCRLIESINSSVPCRDDQYRSPETGRCRSLATQANSLTPCRSDQYRSPETNRCRSIASARTLADCVPGKERNPLTNRCRNASGAVLGSAAHAPERVEDTPMTFAGWGLLVAIMTLGLGYAVWEWRSEIRRNASSLAARLRDRFGR